MRVEAFSTSRATQSATNPPPARFPIRRRYEHKQGNVICYQSIRTLMGNAGVTIKKPKVIGLAILLAIITCATLVIMNTDFTQTNQKNQPAAKITGFSIVDKQWSYLGGLTFDCRFNLTIENKGVSNLTCLELKVKLFSNGSEAQVGNYFDCADENGTLTEPLFAGEVRSCNGTILCNVGDEAYGTNLTSNQTTIVAQLILNGNILNEMKSQ